MKEDIVEKLVHRVQVIEHGFLHIQKTADEAFAAHGAEECLILAKRLFAFEAYQVRSLAVFLLGCLAAQSSESVAFLKKRVSRDPDWRVQEILAKAFDRFCADTGYEEALPVIDEWLADSHSNVRRAVSEGLRIWTGRPYFRDRPEVAVRLLSPLRDDESAYVRKSAGNALRDISKKHRELIRAELSVWDLTDPRVRQTYKLAARFLEKSQR